MTSIENKFSNIIKADLLIQEYSTAKSDIVKVHFSFLLTAQKFLGKFEISVIFLFTLK